MGLIIKLIFAPFFLPFLAFEKLGRLYREAKIWEAAAHKQEQDDLDPEA